MKKFLFLGVFLSVFFLSGCSNSNLQKSNTVEKTTPVQPVEKTTTSSSGEWKEITHDNFWKNTNFFTNADYKFANIKFSYPSNWDFACCRDIDDRSIHTIFSSTEHDTKLPHIVIADYGLMGCSADNANCSADEIVKKTPKEKYDNVVSSVSSNAKIKPEKILKNLNANAFNYEMVDKNGIKVDSYVFKTEQAVIEISFNHFDALEIGFIDNFLEKIKNDKP